MTRFYLDEDVAERLAPQLRRLGLDAVHAREVGRKGARDPVQLTHAVSDGRLLVTCNLNDFELLHEAWLLCPIGNRDPTVPAHHGIAVLPNSNAATDQVLTALVAELAAWPSDLRGRLLHFRSTTGWQELFPRRTMP